MSTKKVAATTKRMRMLLGAMIDQQVSWSKNNGFVKVWDDLEEVKAAITALVDVRLEQQEDRLLVGQVIVPDGGLMFLITEWSYSGEGWRMNWSGYSFDGRFVLTLDRKWIKWKRSWL